MTKQKYQEYMSLIGKHVETSTHLEKGVIVGFDRELLIIDLDSGGTEKLPVEKIVILS